MSAWKEQLRQLGDYTDYVDGSKSDAEVIAEKLLTLQAQLRPKSLSDAFKAEAEDWRALLHALLHPADQPAGLRAPRREDVGVDEVTPLVHQLLNGIAWPPD